MGNSVVKDTRKIVSPASNLGSTLSGYVPYTGAVANVDLDTFTLTTPTINGRNGTLVSTNTAQSSGTVIDFRWDKAAHTGQTASNPINGFLFVSGTRQWATGAITTQSEFEVTAPTYSFVGASTITNAFTGFFNRPNAGTNATITNRWALGTLGPAKFSIASSGLTSPIGGTTIAVESNTTNYLSFMQPDASLGGVTWGSPTDSFGAVISWSLNNNALDIQTARASGIIRFYAGDQSLAMSLSTTLLTFASGVNVTSSGTSLAFSVSAASSGAINQFTFSNPSNTGQTASTEIQGYNFSSYSRTWAAGTITTQREWYIRTVTYAFASASTITNAYGFYVEAPTAGTNATITNNWAAGFAGNVLSTGSILSSSAIGGLGYFTGAGGTVTQLTSKSTSVTLNKICGQITMNNAALAAGAKVSFTVSNTSCAAADMVDCCIASGGTANAYRASVTAVASSSFTITVENITAGSLSEAPVITFAIIKAVTA